MAPSSPSAWCMRSAQVKTCRTLHLTFLLNMDKGMQGATARWCVQSRMLVQDLKGSFPLNLRQDRLQPSGPEL